MSRIPNRAIRPDEAVSFEPSAAPSNETRQGERERSDGSGIPTRSVRLGRTEAACWLEQTRQWAAENGKGSEDLEALRDALEDACWMARWKREDVILELCPGVVAGLLETLVRMHLENSEEMAEALESMVRKLSGN